MENQNKILLVDDDPLLARMYQVKLEKEGFKVTLAFNGKEGLEAVKKEKPDLILLDIMMPVINGIETLKALKADPATKDIPVIILTSIEDRPEDVQRCKDLGADDFWTKAKIELKEVPERVKKILESKPST